MNRNIISALCALTVVGGAFAQTPKKPSTKAAAPPPFKEEDAATLELERFGARREERNQPKPFEMKGQ